MSCAAAAAAAAATVVVRLLDAAVGRQSSVLAVSRTAENTTHASIETTE